MKFLPSLALTAFLALGISAAALPALAHAQAPTPTTATAEYVDETSNAILLSSLEMVSMLLAIIAIVVLSLIIKQFGTSAISVIFGYFIVGTVLLASARLFILFASLGVLSVSDQVVNIGWHLLFYMAMITFFIAGKGFSKLGAGQEVSENFSKVLGWGLASFIVAVLIFILAPVVDEPLTQAFAGSIYDTSGLLHFVALILGGIAAFYLFYRSKVGQVTSLLALPYLVSFGLLALNHFWELLVESWKVVHVSSATGERVEQFFVLPAFMLITYAYIRLWSLLRQHA